MKKLLIAVFTLLTCSAFAQSPQKNGTIYKEHPYITIVNNSMDIFLKQDWDGMTKFMLIPLNFMTLRAPKAISLADVKKGWAGHLCRLGTDHCYQTRLSGWPAI